MRFSARTGTQLGHTAARATTPATQGETATHQPIARKLGLARCDEARVLAQNMRPLLVVHVANTATRIMSARYPEDLVRRPLRPDKTCGNCCRLR